MDKPTNAIYQCLQKLIGLHRQLLECVRVERAALLIADLVAIEKATIAKQNLLEGIKNAETERLKATAALAALWKKPLKELSISAIAIEIQGTDLKAGDQFRSVNTALTVLIERIRDQNEDNRALVEKSLEHIRAMKKNVLGETVPNSNTYTQQGQKSGGMSGARIISKEA